MAARGERLAQLGGHDPAAADRGVAHDADVHCGDFIRFAANNRFTNDEALGPANARERAELRVAALDELKELRRVQSRRNRAVRVRARELARVAIERAALDLVVVRHVNDERRRCRLVDEVVADPLGLPRIALRLIAPQPRIEHGFGQQLARGDMVGMAIGPVGHRHDSRTMTANEGDGLLEVRGILADAAIRYPKIFAPGRAQHLPSRFRFRQPLLGCAVAAHLAARQVAQADLQAKRRMARHGPAEPDLEVVGVRAENKQIDSLHERSQISVVQIDCGSHD